MKPPRPRLGHRIARGLGSLVELADEAQLLQADRLFKFTAADRAALDRAVTYVRALTRWYRDRSFRLATPTKSRSPR